MADACAGKNVTYEDRYLDADHYRFCSVPDSGYDAILFAAIGIVLTCIAPRKHYAIVMLMAGMVLALVDIKRNMREFSNSIALWIGLSPAESFFYIFLPPLLLDSAVRIDFFVFKKVMLQIFVFAFLVVAANTVILATFMLFGLGLRETWGWTDAFLFSTMVASTDAVAVTAIMKECGSPEELSTLIEGESLFNDATSIVFFNLFWPRFKMSTTGELKDEPLTDVLAKMTIEVIWLAFGGLAVGWLFGFLTSWILKLLQKRRHHSPVVEVGVITGVSYLCFYVANAPCKVSGVIAVVVYGLYGSARSLWDMSPKALESKIFESFWDVMSLLINGVVFFYAGALATNYFVRMAMDLFLLSHDMWSLARAFLSLPAIFIGIFGFRFLEIALFAPVLKLMGAELKLSETCFISLAGLRGALALILAQTLLQYEIPDENIEKEKVRAQSALWTCGFTILTLLINAPAIPWLLRVTGLGTIPAIKQQSREKAHQAMISYTETVISHLKKDRDEMLRGVDWRILERLVGLGKDEEQSDNQEKPGNYRAGGHLDRASLRETRWNLLDTLRQPLLESRGSGSLSQFDMEKGATNEEKVKELDRKLLEAEEYDNDAPFTGSLRSKETLFGSKGSIHGVPKVRVKMPEVSKGGTGGGSRRTSLGAVIASTNLNRRSVGSKNKANLKRNGHANGHSQTVMVERTHSHMEEPDSILPPTSGNSFTSQNSTIRFRPPTSQSSFSLRRRDSSLPEIWHYASGDESTGLLANLRLDGQKNPMEASFTGTVRSHSVTAVSETATSAREEANETDGSQEGLDHVAEEIIQEARIRLLAGMKKYFHEKRMAGLLSSRGLRILDSGCDIGMNHPDRPLDTWAYVKTEISGKFMLQWLAIMRYQLRKTIMILRRWPVFLRAPILLVLSPISHHMSEGLTRAMRLALEVAIEFWLALLTYRSHTSLLVDAEQSMNLSREVQKQAELVWQFIIDREIEAPDRFQAVQTFRATKAILHQQMAYVNQLAACGLLDEAEQETMAEDIDEKLRFLDVKGTHTKPPGLADFVRTVPFFANISREVFLQVIAGCHLRLYKSGEVVVDAEHDPIAEKDSIHIVLSGLIRRQLKDRDGNVHDFYLGKGGVLGLLSSLTGNRFPGLGHAFAELNALGQGPSMLTIPHSMVQHIHAMAVQGNSEYQQLELDMFRLSALYVVEYMQDEIMETTVGLFLDIGTVSSRDDQVEAENENPILGGSPVQDGPGQLWRIMHQHVQLVAEEQHTPIKETPKLAEPPLGAKTVHFSTGNMQQWELPTATMLKDCRKKAEEVFANFKLGLMEGNLVLLASSHSFLQGSSFVLVHGSLTTKPPSKPPTERTSAFAAQQNTFEIAAEEFDEKQKEYVDFKAPCVFPWIVDAESKVEPQCFWTGMEGAIVVCCPSGDELLVRDGEIGGVTIPGSAKSPLRYGGEAVHSMPTSTLRVYNDTFGL
ncbi:hypothetical protein BSKO_09706 [Bryopsis sp. KO-2023]|nr:hypothetical protein BSKO_09706 [Bryopsis sp. KO-2023]